MNTFLIMMIAGKIALVTPMHVNLDACKDNARIQEEQIDQRYTQSVISYAGPVTFQGHDVKRSDIAFHCIQADQAPKIEAK